jgi:DNA-binding transcriptional LysR family regulator
MWESVELREIRIFLTLAEELHFGRTAERLRISQARVSQAVRLLERRVGGKLFERTSRRVELTPLGQRCRQELGRPYEELRRGFAAAREAAAGTGGEIRVGAYSLISLGPYWLNIVEAFEARHPECRVIFVDIGLGSDYLELLRSGLVDVLAARLPVSESDITVGPVLSREPRVLAVSRDDVLAQREEVRIDDFSDRLVSDVSAFPREMMDAFVPPVSPSGRRLRRAENRSNEETVMKVAAGALVHPTVPSWLERNNHPRVVGVPISDLPVSETALVWLCASNFEKIHAFALDAARILRQHGLA